MNRSTLATLGIAATLLAAAASAAAPTDEARFMARPDVHGDRIVFAWDGDLWTTTVEGAAPVRLTSHPAAETAPRFSPDGQWIAFVGAYEGSDDVYVIPSTGGLPKRLGYLPGGGTPACWTPDSRHVVFTSRWGVAPVARDQRLYRVALDGSLPEPLPVDRGVACSYSADGQRLAYVRKGNPDYYWKRYKGGQYTDIWTYDFASAAFAPLTDYVGRNTYPMWVGEELYFASDRGPGGITNLFRMDPKTKAVEQVTRFTDVDVLSPASDRKRIVFTQDGYLHVMEPGAAPRKVSVRIPSDDWRLRDRWINPAEYTQSVDAANDGKALVISARGDVFRLGLEGEKDVRARNLTGTPGVREAHPRVSPDGKSVAYFSDETGEYQLYKREIATGAVTRLTDDLKRTAYRPIWSPDGRKLAFGNRDFAIFVLDVATRKLTKIDESRFLDNDQFTWEQADYAWSPDGRWLAYSLTRENRNNAIYLYDTVNAQRTQLTDDFFDNLNPRWDADGGYLYFLSNRNFEIAMDVFEDNHVVANPTRLMVVQLRRGEKPPFAKPVTPEFAAADKPVEAPAKAPEKATDKPAAKPDDARFRVDVEGIAARVFPAPVEPGNFFHLVAGKGHAAWLSVPLFTEDEYEEFYRVGGRTKWTLNVFSMKDEKVVAADDKVAQAEVSTGGEQVVIRKDGKLFLTQLDKVHASKKLGREVDTSGLTYRVSPRAEWRQIFADAWRWYRDFFYDKDMHGLDWKALGDRYRAYVEQIRNRDQLNWVLLQMVGELSVSHTYVSGGDMGPSVTPPTPAVSTATLGVDLAADAASGLYRFARIYGPTPYFSQVQTPLARPDIEIKKGDYLIAINGQKLRAPENYFKRLQVGKEDLVEVTVASAPAGPTRTYRVKPLRSEREARYAAWVSDNVDKVLAASNGELGYMHITAMGGGGVMEFDKFWRAFKFKKGLVIDVRGNGGGWTEYFMIDKLERQQVAYNVLQGMEPYRYPNTASRAHFVVVSNEDNGSDGEAFVEHFKARKLGTVVGVPSWGGLVGIINGQPTIDNGTVHQSNNAFYGKDGKWLVENHGADPDVLIDNDPASVMAGQDAQLDKAIAVALEKIKTQPWQFPPVPAYPKK